MAYRDMDSGVCFETRPNWESTLKLNLPDVSLQMLPDRLPSLSEYVPDDFPSPQLKEDLDGNLIVQLDKDYPRSSAQNVLPPQGCFDVLNRQVVATESAHSLISTSLANYQSTWQHSDCLPETSLGQYSASLGTSVCQNLSQDRNSPFVPGLVGKAATFREFTSAQYVSTQNPSFQTTAFPLQNNFRVTSMDRLPPIADSCDRLTGKPIISSSGVSSSFGEQEFLNSSWHDLLQQGRNPTSLVTSANRKPTSLEAAASSSSQEYGTGSLEDCAVTWSTGSLSSSGLARADIRNANTPSLRKRALASTVSPEDAEAMKLEMKRAKNREAAQRCQQRKQERIARLEGKVGKLKEQNVSLTQIVRSLRDQISNLQRQVVTHVNNGCQLSMPRFFAS